MQQPNQRAHPRINLAAFAAVSADSGMDPQKEYNAVCVNISENGCCLQLNDILTGADIDFGLEVRIVMPDDMEKRLAAKGDIAWLEELDKNNIGKYLIGVRFREISPADKERIRLFIKEELGKI